MAEAAINLTAGQKADRKLDMIFVNVGGSGTETWELLGRGVEDASVEYNHDTDTVTHLHYRLWSAADHELAPFWAMAIKQYNLAKTNPFSHLLAQKGEGREAVRGAV